MMVVDFCKNDIYLLEYNYFWGRWMEYHEKQYKIVKAYDYIEKVTKIIHEADNKINFISHCKLLQNNLLYVEGQKRVYVIHLK